MPDTYRGSTPTDDTGLAYGIANPMPIAIMAAPPGVTNLVASSGNLANASAVATLAAAGGSPQRPARQGQGRGSPGRVTPDRKTLIVTAR
jgi:hypothetical protein